MNFTEKLKVYFNDQFESILFLKKILKKISEETKMEFFRNEFVADNFDLRDLKIFLNLVSSHQTIWPMQQWNFLLQFLIFVAHVNF